MSPVPFAKMEGCGNDFVVVYRHHLPESASPALATSLCDRHRGVGADGVLVIEHGPSLSQADSKLGALARMLVWNSDGSVAEMCGNGLRCVVRRLAEDGFLPEDEALIVTGAGTMPVSLIDDDIRVAAGRPEAPEGNQPRVQDWRGLRLSGHSVSMGNPHFVLFAQDQPANLPDLLVWGPDLEVAPEFPNRTNVEWVRIDATDPGEITMRVWERGVGETQACGSGACAVSVAARLQGRVAEGPVTIHLPGGSLRVDWSGRLGDLAHITGPARTVFRGTLEELL